MWGLLDAYAVLSAILLGCSSVPYLINEICDPEKPQKIEISNFNKIVELLPSLQGEEKLTKVEIVNLKELQMSENKPTQPTQNQKAPPQEQKPAPQKPTPPQGRVSLEHLEPKKK